jgi:hypothetical protein
MLVLLEKFLQTCMTYTSAECTMNKFLMMDRELPETRRVKCRSKFGKLMHLVGFIIKKFVTMHGHTNVRVKDCEISANADTRHSSAKRFCCDVVCNLVFVTRSVE